MTRATLLAGLALAGLLAAGTAPAQSPSSFDHLGTGFALTGGHQAARCESCHVRGVFKGTPRQCASCHTAGRGIAASVMAATHIPVTQTCDACHNTATFSGARFSHVGVRPGSCMSCHNGMQASGKPSGHVVTAASCDACHRTTSYTPAFFNHANVAAGGCLACHASTRKPTNHVVTSASCDSCHRTTAWLPATFNHAGVAVGSCLSCHASTPKPTNHVVTSASCDSCHRTTAWLPATFNHAGIAAGSCLSCHASTAKPTTHMQTSRSCDACHTTTAWTPARTYAHLSPFYKPHNTGVTCASCHKANTEAATWTFAAYKPDCAGCHASRFKPDAHKKVDSPKILYTVAELKDCAGSCHEYTNSTFTTIRRTRSGEHRSTGGGF